MRALAGADRWRSALNSARWHARFHPRRRAHSSHPANLTFGFQYERSMTTTVVGVEEEAQGALYAAGAEVGEVL